MKTLTTYTIDFDGEFKDTIYKQFDGNYSLFLNPAYSDEKHARSYILALYHIKNDTFDKAGTDRIELE
jgi:hypothetical protein